MIDRRGFLGAAAGGIAGASPLARFLASSRLDRLGKIGVQLYTIRDALKADFEGSLARVAEIGYREVEFAGYFDHPARDVRRILHRHGLAAPAAHISLEDIRTRWARTLDDAHTIGHRYLVCAWINDEDRSPDGYRRVAAEFNGAAEAARKAGIGFAYHNHSYEFVPLAGRLPYDILLDGSDPELVKFEMDLFWITRGGGDPFAYFARYPGRFPLVHVKDFEANGTMTDVGKGVIDWKALFAKADLGGVKHYFMEFDDPKAPFESVQASYEYLEKLSY